MSLDLWGKEDIENVLLSLHQTTLQSGADGDYQRGFEAALVALALAFGIEVNTAADGRKLPPALPERGWRR